MFCQKLVEQSGVKVMFPVNALNIADKQHDITSETVNYALLTTRAFKEKIRFPEIICLILDL